MGSSSLLQVIFPTQGLNLGLLHCRQIIYYLSYQGSLLHGKQMENKCKQWQILFSWAPKSLQIVTAAMKLRHSLLARKTVTHLDSILESRDITLLTKVCLVKAMVFLVVMYGCRSRNMKKDECQRIDAFKLWCWRRCLRVLWTARRSNQSILKEISPEYSLEGLMLKLKL